jgi:hypothetical protein
MQHDYVVGTFCFDEYAENVQLPVRLIDGGDGGVDDGPVCTGDDTLPRHEGAVLQEKGARRESFLIVRARPELGARDNMEAAIIVRRDRGEADVPLHRVDPLPKPDEGEWPRRRSSIGCRRIRNQDGCEDGTCEQLLPHDPPPSRSRLP